MTENIITRLFRKIYELIIILISMAGYVPRNATIPRSFIMIVSLAFAIYLGNYQPDNSRLAIFYFILSEIFYLGFISIILSHNGFRSWFIERWPNEDEGYLAYEAILGFLFFHNGVSIGYIASSSQQNILEFVPGDILIIPVAILFITGFAVKILAAKAVGIEIYYWKDMFLGRKICDFIVSGPYKYFSNPMYGIGQLQAYAIAIWYGSAYGLIAAFINQFLIFSFYFLVERKFIQRVYQNMILEPVSLK